jgi:hypothetical protein
MTSQEKAEPATFTAGITLENGKVTHRLEGALLASQAELVATELVALAYAIRAEARDGLLG